MKISICGYSFHNLIKNNEMDIFSYLEAVKYRYHLDAVDIWNGQICENHSGILKLPSEMYLMKICKALEEKGLKLINFAVDGAHIWDADAERREHLRINALEHIKAAEILGAKNIRIDSGGDFNADPRVEEEQMDYIVERYTEYADIAAESGLVIGPENHMGPTFSPKKLKEIVERVNRDNFGVLLHIGRWKELENKGDAMVADLAYHTHFGPSLLKDEKSIIENIRLLIKGGYKGYWSVEHNAESNQYAEVALNLAQLRLNLQKAQNV